MNKIAAGLALLFGLLGVGLLIGAGVSAQETRAFLKHSVETEGRVVEVSTHVSETTSEGRTVTSTGYTPIYEYTGPDGERLRHKSSQSSGAPDWKIGDPVRLRYLPSDPTNARVVGFMDTWFIAVLLGGIGFVFCVAAGLIGYLGTLGRRERAAQQRWLDANGRRVPATVTFVESNTHEGEPGRHPWRVICSWQEGVDGEEHEFVSDDVWAPSAPVAVGETVDVLIDPRDPSVYRVEINAGAMPRPARR